MAEQVRPTLARAPLARILAGAIFATSFGCNKLLQIGTEPPDGGFDSGPNLCVLPDGGPIGCMKDQAGGSYGDPCTMCGLICTVIDAGAGAAACQLPNQLVSCQPDSGCFFVDAGGGLHCVENIAGNTTAGLCVFRCESSADCPSLDTTCQRNFPYNPSSGPVCDSNICDLFDGGPYLECDASAPGSKDGQCLPYDTSMGFATLGSCTQNGTVPTLGPCQLNRLDRDAGPNAICAADNYCFPGTDAGASGLCLPLAKDNCTDAGVLAVRVIPNAAWALCLGTCSIPDQVLCADPTLTCTGPVDGGTDFCLPP